MKREGLKESRGEIIVKGLHCLNDNATSMQFALSKGLYLVLYQVYKFLKLNSIEDVSFNLLNESNDSGFDAMSLKIRLNVKEWIQSFFQSVHQYINGNEYLHPLNESFFQLSFVVIKEICRSPPFDLISLGEKSELNETLFDLLCDYYIILNQKDFFLHQFSRLLSMTEASVISYKFHVILKKVCLKFHSSPNEKPQIPKEMIDFIQLHQSVLRLRCESNDKAKPKGFSLVNLLFSRAKQLQPKELDGSSINDIFTVLNVCDDYSNGFKNNVVAFSCSYELLRSITRLSISSSQLFKEMKSMLYSYCIRLFDQSENFLESIKNKAAIEPSTEFNLNLIEATVLEALKLINVLCKEDSSLINSIFMRMKQVLERIAMKQSGLCFLEILQFFIDNYNSIIVDLDSHVSDFIRFKLRENYKNEVLAFLTFEFLHKNTSILKTQTTVFTSFFPLFIKMFSFYPKYVHSKYFELLNNLTQPETITELFNYILDLPAVILLIENFDCFKLVDTALKLKREEMFHADYFNLIELLLRDVSSEKTFQYSGDYYKQYNSQMKFLFEALISTSRVHSTTKVLPKFLNHFFDVVINLNDISNALELTQLIIERFSNFHGSDSFKHDIRLLLISKLEEIFTKWPQIVTELYETILFQIKAHYNSPIRRELIIFLLWAIGEFLSIQSEGNSFQEVSIKNTFDCLQTIFIENIPTFSKQTSSSFSSFQHDEGLPVNDLLYQFTHYFIAQTTDEEVLNERIMTVLIMTLSKLSFKFKSFAGRILKCFGVVAPSLRSKTIKDTLEEMIVSFENISIGTEYLIN